MATAQTGQDLHAGLAADLEHIRQRIHRRKLLGWMVSGGSLALMGACGGSGTSSTSSATGGTATTAASSGCVAFPEETNGPFPADGTNSEGGAVINVLTQSGIVRSDITSSFGTSTTTAPGVPLTLMLALENAAVSCAVLSGYAIYIWHCDRSGDYSLYSSGITDENYLRGVQVTDSNGQATFHTVFPACYSGRYPHIHVEVYESLSAATSGSNALLITQLAMPRDVCSTIYATATGYSQSVSNLAQISTGSDNVFDASTSPQLIAQTPGTKGDVASGYTATVTLGVSV